MPSFGPRNVYVCVFKIEYYSNAGRYGKIREDRVVGVIASATKKVAGRKNDEEKRSF